MIEAKHTYMGEILLRYYSGYRLGRAFHPIRFVNRVNETRLPILLIANHFCWWDGFIQYQYNQRYLGRKAYVMMLEEQLLRHRILNSFGAYSVRKHSRSAIESLRYTIDLLQDSRNMVVFFPQGEIQTMHTTEFRFQGGLAYILRHLGNDIQLIFNINLPDYYSQKSPSLTIYTSEYDYKSRDVEHIETAFNEFARQCRIQQNSLWQTSEM